MHPRHVLREDALRLALLDSRPGLQAHDIPPREGVRGRDTPAPFASRPNEMVASIPAGTLERARAKRPRAPDGVFLQQQLLPQWRPRENPRFQSQRATDDQS